MLKDPGLIPVSANILFKDKIYILQAQATYIIIIQHMNTKFFNNMSWENKYCKNNPEIANL